MAFLFLLLLLPFLPSPSAFTDTETLTAFRQLADVHGILTANWSTPNACTAQWRGVTCSNGRVTSLLLPLSYLRGSLNALSRLDQLRYLDLHGNKLNGTLAALFSSLLNLKFLYLSNNDFSGEIPPSIGGLKRIVRIDLSDNDLDGFIPGNALGNLTRLLTLRLQNNLLCGEIPDLTAILPKLVQFNASNNQLSGFVPGNMLKKFGLSAVAGNEKICAQKNCSFIPPVHQPIVPSKTGFFSQRKKEGLSKGAIFSIVIGSIAFFLILCFSLLACCCCKGNFGEKDGKLDDSVSAHKRNSLNSLSDEEENKRKRKGMGRKSEDEIGAEAMSKLVFFEKRRKKGRKFELDELLRASAEMLGKGSVGTVYRAGLEDGELVAVKRLKDANPCGFKDFNKYMNLIGCVSHPNVVPLRAYYYAKQEKLLIYDYLPNGTLFSLLHGSYFSNSFL